MSVVDLRPTLYGDLERWAMVCADSLQLLRSFPDSCVDSIVTDPPYAIGFGGEAWDDGELADPVGFQSFSADWATEAKRVLKPGGHMVAFGSPRTFHRMVAGCEDAGLEIRDQLLWLHGRGVPKSPILADGISTTLKPAYEPILLARVPLELSSSAENIERYGTGGMNIDACRVPREDRPELGYWPSQVILSHEIGCETGGSCSPDCAVAVLDQTGGDSPTRLFYVGKATQSEREAGLDRLPHTDAPIFSTGKPLKHARANVHPTVKPLDVMRWLVRLITPPGGLVLDPFAGSGSTGCAAMLEDRQFIGIEQDKRYIPIARARLEHWRSRAL